MFGSEVIRLDTVDSTNDEARRRLAAAPPPAHGTVIVAARQTAGRGAGSKPWISDERLGLWMSLVLRSIPRTGPLPFVPALALVDVLRLEYEIDAHLKWPNDVLVGTLKIGGVLCESLNGADGRPAWIVGLGVNVNQVDFPEEIRGVAVSLRQLTGLEHDIGRLLPAVIARIEAWLEDDVDLIAAWRERSRMIGSRVCARRRGESLTATVRDVDREGRLVVERDDGRRERWVSASDLDIAPDYAP